MVNTKFAIEKRDLFTVPKDYFLCHCISADFALGAGIAKKFAELGVRDSLINFYAPYEWNGEGKCLFTSATEWGELNLITKEKFWHKPTLLTLRQSLNSLKKHLISGDKIAMPKIGCGLDRLKWNDVEQIIKDVFADTDVEILVCDWRRTMRDINRLDKFYDELKEIHKKNFPDWRFGQLIVNVLADWQAKTKRDIFFPEEDEMIQIFRDYVNKS